MLKLGMTGCAGSGKSEAASIFSSFGVEVIDADQVARQLVEIKRPCYERIVRHFGAAVCLEDGRLNRPLLRKKMLGEADSKRALEEIMHPAIREQLVAMGKKANPQSAYCVFVIPLLIESGMVDLVDSILVIDCDEETCIRRLRERDRCSPHEARALIRRQMPRQERLKYAHYIIDNNIGKAFMKRQLRELHKRLQAGP